MAEAVTVYVLTAEVSYEPSTVHGVYTTREAARAAAEAHPTYPADGRWTYDGCRATRGSGVVWEVRAFDLDDGAPDLAPVAPRR